MDHRISIAIIIVLTALQTACSKQIDVQNDNDVRIITGTGYLVHTRLYERYSRIQDGFFTANYPKGTNPNKHDFDDQSITIYDSLNTPCSSDMSRPYGRFIDAEVRTEDGAHTVQGKLFPPVCPMDACKPPLPEFPGKYGFCSEKNGKTVFIEIFQATDDEGLASSIFSTFRWTE